jgi:hypothetical protein
VAELFRTSRTREIQDKGKGSTFALFLAQLPFYYSVVLAKRWPFRQPPAHQVSLQAFIGSGIVDWHALAAALPNFRPLVRRLVQPQRVFPAVSRKVRLGSGSTTPGI